MGFKLPSQVCSRRKVADAFPRRPGPRAVRRRILTDRFHRLFRPANGSVVIVRRANRGLRWFGFRASLPSLVRPSPKLRAILPWALSSFRVVGAAFRASRGRTRRIAKIIDPWPQLPATNPLLGLRRPSCADVPALTSGFIHLHGAFGLLRRRRPFSVLRGRCLADPAVGKPPGPAPCLRFRTCR
jgi:hypothetical protein